MSDEPDDVDVTFAAALARLRPTAVVADPIAAAFAAGQASGRSRLNQWRATAAAAAVVAAIGMWHRPTPATSPVPSTVVVNQPVPLPVLPQPGRPDELVHVEQALLDRGLDGLPPAPRRPVFPDRLPTF